MIRPTSEITSQIGGTDCLFAMGKATDVSRRYFAKFRTRHCVILGETDAGSPGCSDSSDVGGEEVDAVSVEVAAGAVVVLGRARVCMAGEDLGIT